MPLVKSILVGLLACPLLTVASPNIIFILTDDLGYGDLGVLYQNSRSEAKKLLTPQLDAMASEGTILNRHYCPAPVCAPSRGSLLSGMHQGHANIRNRQFDKAIEDNHTLASTLKQAGYYTAIIGKYGMQGTSGNSPATWSGYPTKRGFDYFYGYAAHADGHQHYPANTWSLGNSSAHRSTKKVYENNNEVSSGLDKCYTTDLFTARAKKLIIDQTTNSPDTPFFIYLAYDTPHAALQLPTVAYPTGSGLNGGLQWIGTSGSMINTATGTIDSYIDPLYSNRGWPNTHERFATMVTRIDHCIGDLLQTLRDLEIDDNTIVVFSSDNGPHKESYMRSNGGYAPTAFESYGPLEGEKQDSFEGGIRVPSLAWGPGHILAESVSEHPSQFHDWMATFCEFAEITPPARTDGVSLIPTLSGIGTQKTGTVYVEYDASGSMSNYNDFSNHGGTTRNESQVIYLDGYKGIRNNVTSHTVDFKIYDTLTDLSESNDLAATSPYFISLQQQMKDEVLRIRQPNTSATRAYDNELVPASNPPVENGIEVSTYEGTWQWVPEFEVLSPLSTQDVTNLSVSHLSRATEAGLLYTGFIEIPIDGTWTFYSQSDQGSILRIHDSLVIDDDFNHDGSEQSGTIKLQAGFHPFRLYYRSSDSAPSLSLQWEGPQTGKAPIPDAALYRNAPASPIPVARPDFATTKNTNPVTIQPLANDSDDNAPSPLSLVAISPPIGGAIETSGDSITYTPNADFYGTDRFSYSISDGEHIAESEITVTVYFDNGELWLPFNQIEGTTTTDANGMPRGNVINVANTTSHWVSGKHNQACNFDGINDYITVTDYSPPFGADDRTITAWIQTTGHGAVAAWGGTSAGKKYHFRLENEATHRGKLRLEVANGYIIGSTPVNDGEWHHIAMVFSNDGSPDVADTRLYVDGQLEEIDSVSSQTIDTTSTTVTIGTDSQDRYFPGIIDELRIYPRALTAMELLNQYNASGQASAAWHREHFGDAAQDWSADVDGDSFIRLYEYGFGGNPHSTEQTLGMPEAFFNRATNSLEASFPRRLEGTHELNYTIQLSNDLQTWTLPYSEKSTTPHPSLTGFEQITVETVRTQATEPKQFLRIELSQ